MSPRILTMHEMPWTKTIGLALVAMILWTDPAQAFRMIQSTAVGRVNAGAAVTCNHPGGFIHWADPNIPWRLNPTGQGSNKAGPIINALNTWTNVPNADHTLNYLGTTGAGEKPAPGNGAIPEGKLWVSAVKMMS